METCAFITLLMYVVAVHRKMADWPDESGIAVAAIVNFTGIVMV